MLQRHLNDYAVSGNHLRIWWFCNQVRSLWLASATQPEGQPLRERFIRFVATRRPHHHDCQLPDLRFHAILRAQRRCVLFG
jgi:hypothetical protein